MYNYLILIKQQIYVRPSNLKMINNTFTVKNHSCSLHKVHNSVHISFQGNEKLGQTLTLPLTCMNSPKYQSPAAEEKKIAGIITKRRCPRLENRSSGFVSSVTSRGKHLAFVRSEHSSNLQEKYLNTKIIFSSLSSNQINFLPVQRSSAEIGTLSKKQPSCSVPNVHD